MVNSLAMPQADRVNQLVEDNIGLAHAAAARFAGRGEANDDLIQVALLGLIRAAGRFDAQHGVSFSTYATATILGTLKHHFRDTRWGLRVPRSLQERYLRVRDAVDDLGHSLGRSPTIAEIASSCGLSQDDVVEALEVGTAFRVESLDAPLDGAGGRTRSELAGTDDGTEEVDRAQTVEALLSHLPERDAHIVRLRFLGDLTQREIGQMLGVSQMHVSRLLARSLATLREVSVETPSRVASARV